MFALLSLDQSQSFFQLPETAMRGIELPEARGAAAPF
jgi:hypothetical protein